MTELNEKLKKIAELNKEIVDENKAKLAEWITINPERLTPTIAKEDARLAIHEKTINNVQIGEFNIPKYSFDYQRTDLVEWIENRIGKTLIENITNFKNKYLNDKLILFNCPVCLADKNIDETEFFECGTIEEHHFVCSTCYQYILKSKLNKSCPMCRKDIKLITFYDKYAVVIPLIDAEYYRGENRGLECLAILYFDEKNDKLKLFIGMKYHENDSIKNKIIEEFNRLRIEKYRVIYVQSKFLLKWFSEIEIKNYDKNYLNLDSMIESEFPYNERKEKLKNEERNKFQIVMNDDKQ